MISFANAYVSIEPMKIQGRLLKIICLRIIGWSYFCVCDKGNCHTYPHRPFYPHMAWLCSGVVLFSSCWLRRELLPSFAEPQQGSQRFKSVENKRRKRKQREEGEKVERRGRETERRGREARDWKWAMGSVYYVQCNV